MDDTGVTDRKTKSFNKSKARLGFTTRKTQNHGGTEQFIAALKVGALQTHTCCAR